MLQLLRSLWNRGFPTRRLGGVAGLALILMFQSAAAQDSPPTVSVKPLKASVSLGATVTFRATGTGSPPLTYQWVHDSVAVVGATNATFAITNVVRAHAGGYFVVITNPNGSATSQVATLTIDPTFTKITTGPVATDGGDSSGCAWGDYDNDGFIDLFVGNNPSFNALYHNNGDGTFTRATNVAPVLDHGYGCAWGDFNNDGNLDLVVANQGANYLYRNDGDGVFTKVPFAGAVGALSWGPSWADYDLDGWLDLFIANGANNNDILLLNNRDGTFTRITKSPVVTSGGSSIAGSWADYDEDGFPDLFVANNGGPSFLFHNNRDGVFTRVSTEPFRSESGNAIVADWGDYNNDGHLDLAVSRLGPNLLYRNDGTGAFTKINTGPLVTDSQQSEICQWIDYDNDGFLDLFVANASGQNNALYHNNGDGTFSRVTTGSIVNDGGNSAGGAWGDYDNDGFLDLFVPNWQGSRPNFLYRNNGNSNSWLKVRCVGVVSNRDAVGAKVRVRAFLRGAKRLQIREISGGIGFGQTPYANFGLGDATNAELVRVEWPCGLIEELNDTAVKQFLTLTEPVAYITPANQAIPAGSTASFMLTTTLSQPFLIQWSRNGIPLPGETNTVLAITDIRADFSGRYSVTITQPGSRLTVTPVPAALSISVVTNQSPVITLQPVSQSIVAGGSVTLSASAEGNPSPLVFRWFKDSSFVADFVQEGANGFLTVTNLRATSMTNQFYFSVLVTNLTGSAVSSNAIITVLADTDGDGMPDEWELANHLSPTNSADASEDSDGDGVANAAEYLGGTDPLDPQSYLSVKSITIQGQPPTALLAFLALATKTYSLLRRDSEPSGAWIRVTDVPASASNHVVLLRDSIPLAPGQNRRFYRLVTPRFAQ